MDGQTENQKPILHLAKAGGTKKNVRSFCSAKASYDFSTKKDIGVFQISKLEILTKS